MGLEINPTHEQRPSSEHLIDYISGWTGDLKANTINEQVKATVDPETTIISDGYNGYNKLKLIVKQHDVINTTELVEVHKVLPWVHSAIGNAKKILDGIHHSNGQDYLQNYLNEYCYKYNRRYFGERIFDRLLIACIENS